MAESSDAPWQAVSFWEPAKRDTERRARESRRNTLRGTAAAWVIVSIGVVSLAVLVWIWHLTRPTGVYGWIALGAPALVVGLLVATAMRPIKRARPPSSSERDHVCKLTDEGVRLSCPVDELLLDWKLVEITGEPNWIAIAHPFGAAQIPREAFDDGADRMFEEFARKRCGHDTAANLLTDPPESAVAFSIEPDAITGSRRHRRTVTFLAVLMVLAAVAVFLLMLTLLIEIPTNVALCIAAGAATFATLDVVRDARRNHARSRSVWGSPRRVWVTERALVTQSDGWEHRIAREAIEGIERCAGVVLVRAKETGCVLADTVVSSAPALRELVATVESRPANGGA